MRTEDVAVESDLRQRRPREEQNSAKPFDLLAQQRLPPLPATNAKKSESLTRSPLRGKGPVPPFAQPIITSLTPRPSPPFLYTLISDPPHAPRDSVVDEGGGTSPRSLPTLARRRGTGKRTEKECRNPPPHSEGSRDAREREEQGSQEKEAKERRAREGWELR